VPGPQIITEVGDKVQVELTNNTPMGTDIHWHGISTPNDQDGVSPFTQEVIKTGETFTYEFVTDKPRIGMYHAHMHSQISVVNGMFAAFRVGERPYPRGMTISGVTIPEDFEPDVELPMVLNDAGTIGLTLNGKSFPGTEPLVLEAGDWVAADYYNEGLTAHPMHQHQFPQLVYAKDGIALDYPYWADTVNVAPGERYSVLFQAADPGVWVWHCHILTHVERDTGMFGMVTAVIVNEPEGTVEEAAETEAPSADTTAEG
jgi:FtsP/CotA-like multicopper oxidase with cupredoxin domain